MEKVRNIKAKIVKDNMPIDLWEGQILIKPTKTFEGIVSDRYGDTVKDYYICGEIRENSMNVIIDLENDNNSIKYFELNKESNEKYYGTCFSFDDCNELECIVNVEKKYCSNSILNEEARELRQILDYINNPKEIEENIQYVKK